MKRHISTGSLGAELGARIALLAIAGIALDQSLPPDGRAAPGASTGFRHFLLEQASGYAARVHDAVSMIVTLPLF